jgi:hypothetical protein
VIFSRRQFKTALVASVALGIAAPSARAEDTAAQAASRQAITAIYEAMDRATTKKDLESFFAILTPDFQSKSKDGSLMNRAEFEMQQRRLWETPGLQILSAQTKIDKVEWFGAEAIVWSSSSVKMKIGNSSVEGTGTSRDLWHPKDGKWWLKRTVELESKIKVDGKAVPSP